MRAADVLAAAQRVAPVALRTPLERSRRLSEETGVDVWLKREDLQVVRSYKIRGAYNLICSLTEAERQAGVVCASAGNHAQGVAHSCRTLGVAGRVFVPHSTPRQKIERIRALGGEWVSVELVGATYDAAGAAAAAYAASQGSVLVPPFDDPRTIAGQGTVAVELVGQLGRSPDVVVAPVGGGGLVSGMAAYLKEQPQPSVIVGVEPAGAASMTAALRAGHLVTLDDIDTFVDGAAVRTVGRHTFALTQALVDHVLTVDEGAACTEMLRLYQSEGIIAEPAGALAVAALGHVAPRFPGATVVCVVSGGNNDVTRYGEVIERSLVHQGLKHYFLVEFPQEPGALRRFLDEVLGPDDDITLFEYMKKNNREFGPALVGVELVSRDDYAPLLARMQDSPLRIEPVPPDSPLFAFLV